MKELPEIFEKKIAECKAKRAARLADKLGEPLSNIDFGLYKAVLEEMGVPSIDAERQSQVLRKEYFDGNETTQGRIGQVMESAIIGVIEKPHEPISVMTPRVINMGTTFSEGRRKLVSVMPIERVIFEPIKS